MKRSIAAPAASPSATSPPEGGKYGAVDVNGRVSRSGAEFVTLLRKVIDGFALGARANMGPSDGLARPRANERISGRQPSYAGARWL
jgi:hypothetical protein